MSLLSKTNHISINSPSRFIHFMETSRRTKLHTHSTNSWLKTRHPGTTSFSYLCFPHEKEQHNLILEVFQLFDTSRNKCIKIDDLIKIISTFNGRIPRTFLHNLFHHHDLDKDDALNLEEFSNCALSQKGKLIFSNILKKMKVKKDSNNVLPLSFNSLITEVSYNSARNDLLKRCCDTSIDIHRRAGHFFKLFGLRDKFKNPDDYNPDNTKLVAAIHDPNQEKVRKNSLFSSESNDKDVSVSDQVVKLFNESLENEEEDYGFDLEKLVFDSKLKGEELAQKLKISERTKSLKHINIADPADPSSSTLFGIDRNKRTQEEKNKQKRAKMAKIMNENLKESKKNKASKIFKEIIGFNETQRHRQIKFYPIQINRRQTSQGQEASVSNDKRDVHTISLRNEEFEIFLPKIEKLKNPESSKCKLEKLPTIKNMFNEDFIRFRKGNTFGISEFKV